MDGYADRFLRTIVIDIEKPYTVLVQGFFHFISVLSFELPLLVPRYRSVCQHHGLLQSGQRNGLLLTVRAVFVDIICEHLRFIADTLIPLIPLRDVFHSCEITIEYSGVSNFTTSSNLALLRIFQ